MLPRGCWVLSLLLILAAGVFLAGINWGLPSRSVDSFLFGSHSVWTGEQILKLAGPTEDPNRGADVASHASTDRSSVVVVNATDEDRARIVRRYRLMSYQPDEWNTLKALSEMKPREGNFDPKLYQYGGLWVYPVGAMLKAASLLGVVSLRSDVTWYLDHPQAFGQFYVIARLWSVLWGLVGVVTIFSLVQRIVGEWFFPAIAGACFIFMPVVVNMANEAKPHLAGTVLMLLAVLMAARYVERGTRSAWMLAGVLCGAALGMVLSTLPVFLVLPAMVLLRKSEWQQKLATCAAAGALGIGVYLITNPYVPLNFIRNRAVLQSNLGNSKEMYHANLTAQGVANAGYLIAIGTSPALAFAGVAGAVALGLRAVRMRKNKTPLEIRRRATGLLLAVPALCVAGQCVAFATAKPAEFGRFMLLTDVFLAVEAVVAIATFIPSVRARAVMALILLVTTAIPGIFYVRAFVADSGTLTSRLVEAERIEQLTSGLDTPAVAIHVDPAPYCLPPVDLFRTKLVLLPKGAGSMQQQVIADVSIRTTDDPARPHRNGLRWLEIWTATPISWADKPFELRTTNRGKR